MSNVDDPIHPPFLQTDYVERWSSSYPNIKLFQFHTSDIGASGPDYHYGIFNTLWEEPFAATYLSQGTIPVSFSGPIKATVEGTLKNLLSNYPIAGATVTVFENYSKALAYPVTSSATSDSEGRVVVRNPRAGFVNIRVEAPGFKSIDKEFYVNRGVNLLPPPLALMTPLPSDFSPIGTLDSINGSGVVAGWALDQDVPAQSIPVHFYIEGNVFIGDAVANESRPDVNQAFNVTGNHGFVWTIPSQYRDGKTHQLFVYAIDNSGKDNPLLWSAPKTFMLPPPGGTITVNSFPSGARVWFRLNGGDWTDSGTETPHTWSGIPVGSYDVILKKKGYADTVVPVPPLTDGGNLTLDGTLKVLPLTHVKHFGMVHANEAFFPEVAALDSINLAMVRSESDFGQIVSSGKKAIMSLQEIFFSPETTTPDPGRTFPGRADYVLRGDHVSRWESFVQKNNLLAHTQKIGGFYLVDEPYWNNLTYEDIQAAAWLVKQDFPTTPIVIVEAYPVLEHQNGADLRVPNMVDWVGFDKYYVRHPAADPGILADLAELKSKLTPKQRIVFIGDAFWSPSHMASGITQEEMADVFTEQIELARAEPLVVAFVNFVWDTPTDVPDSLGAGKLPLSVRETYESVGKSILANPAGDRIPPTVSITAPMEGALVAETSSLSIEVNVQDETALVGVEFYVDGRWIGTAMGAPFRWTLMAKTVGVGTHQVEAIAFDGEGNSRLSAPVSLTVQKTLGDLRASANSTAIELAWKPVADDGNLPPVRYLVDVSPDPTFSSFVGDWENKNVGLDTTATVPNLSEEKTYFVRLKAQDTSGKTTLVAVARVSTISAFDSNPVGSETVDTARAYPSPVRPGRGENGITFDHIPEESVVTLFSVDGRLVKTLPTTHTGVVRWDLRNDEGAPVASGVYIGMIKKGGSMKSMKVVVLR